MSEGDNEDKSQKTEEPTQRKLEKSREEGETFSSKEVSAFLSFCTFAILIITIFPWSAKNISLLLSQLFSQPDTFISGQVNIKQLVINVLCRSFLYIAPIMLLFACFDILSSLLQQGLLFAPKVVLPKLNRLSIIQGFKRVFSANALVEMVKGLAKISLVGYAIYTAIKPNIMSIVQATSFSVDASLVKLTKILSKMLVAASTSMFFIASLDYLYQRVKYMNKMKMSKKEVKDEHKQTEGSPEVKSKLRSLQLKKARNRMRSIVPQATVIVTNPTHYSIALLYDEEKMESPKLIAKGVDEIALIIREIARENKIPIIENAPLARSLYSKIEVDSFIDKSHYKAVAKIISKIFSMRKGHNNNYSKN